MALGQCTPLVCNRVSDVLVRVGAQTGLGHALQVPSIGLPVNTAVIDYYYH